MIRIVILAPTPVARAGLRGLLANESAGDLVVVAEATGSHDLPVQVSASLPDLLLIDLPASDEVLLDTLQRLTSEHPALKTIVLGPALEDSVIDALRTGANAYLRIDCTGPELAAAVRATALNLTVLDPAAAGPVLDRIGGYGANRLPDLTPPPPLTVREVEVLQLLAQGYTNRGIAAQLKISEHTAKFHVSALLTKLGAGSRAEAVALAARQGLILV